MNLFRCLPGVDALARACRQLLEQENAFHVPQPYLNNLAAAFLDEQRAAIRNGLKNRPEQLELNALLPSFAWFAGQRLRPSLQPVLNATGVVLHTNMGRAPLAGEAVDAIVGIAGCASNLELDLATGERGSRYSHVSELLAYLTGAEAAVVVNNNAAAVLLVLDTLCKGGEVPVSRGQLVEIGGSFRIPEIMEKSGATLVEVGATNRTGLADYENALNERTKALLRVHTSNYRITGFTAQPELAELAALAHSRGLPLIDDLGSGSFVDFSPFGLPDEPTVQQAVAAGVDVLTFSGDKLLGGPQAGIICGKAEYVDQIRKNQLNRALRVDKLTLAALEATLRLYLEPESALRRIPTLHRLTVAPDILRKRAAKLARLLRRVVGAQNVTVRSGASTVGGGAFPTHELPTSLVSVEPVSCSAEALRRALLKTEPPLLGRVENDRFLLDPRTLDDVDLPHVARVLAQALGQTAQGAGAS